MKTKKNFILGLFSCLCLSNWAQVNIDVNVVQKGIEISPELYGIFYEDINFASDGGLYAELIRNRSFEYNTEQPDFWKAEGANISLVEDNSKFNTPQKPAPWAENWVDHALKVEITEPDGKIINEGYWGINAVAGTRYKLSFWVKPLKIQGAKFDVLASLTTRDGKVLGQSSISIQNSFC